MLRFVDFVASLGRSPGGSGWILAGDEDFLRTEAERAVVRAVFGGKEPAAGVVTIEAVREGGALVSLAEVLDEARTPSLFSERKVVSVRRASALVRASADALAEFLAEGGSPGVLLLHTEVWDKRAAYAKKLDRFAVDCSSLYETAFGESEISASSPLGRWVRDRAHGAGLRPTNEAVVRLIELVGANLGELAGAIERIALARGGRGAGALSPAEVDAAVAPSRTYSQFRVAELALTGRAPEAFEAADACFEQGVEKKGGRMERSEGGVAESLVWAISQELERQYVARGLLEEGRLDARTAGALGVPPFRLAAFTERVRSSDAERLGLALGAVLETAKSLRGESEPRAAVERLVLRLGGIMGGAPPRARETRRARAVV